MTKQVSLDKDSARLRAILREAVDLKTTKSAAAAAIPMDHGHFGRYLNGTEGSEIRVLGYYRALKHCGIDLIEMLEWEISARKNASDAVRTSLEVLEGRIEPRDRRVIYALSAAGALERATALEIIEFALALGDARAGKIAPPRFGVAG